MSPAIFPQRLILAGLFASLPLFGGFREDIGFGALQNEFESLPDGSSLKVAHIEYVRDAVWAPQAVGELSGKSIVYSPSTPASFSYHGDEVGRVFYGSSSSIIPGVNQIRAFEAWNYYDYSLNTLKGTAPAVADWDVENHSYISNAGLSNNEGGRRLDYRIDRDGTTATVVLENGTGTIPALFGNTYNTIVVGSSTGSHSRGGTTRDVNGRLKPDIVGTANYTSYAAPIVGSAAGLLIAKAKSDSALTSAKRPEVVKALLMAGATKDEFPSWSRSASAPLDPVFGAGEVNVANSYRILIAGRQAASPSTVRANRGWDLNTAGVGSSQRYLFTVGAGQSGTLSAVLTWHRNVAPNNGAWNQGVSASLDNLDLRLYRATAQYQTTDLLQDSISTIDNVEHVYLRNLTEGTYVLEVSALSGSKQFGIAWMVSGVSGEPEPPPPPPSPVAPAITKQPAALTVTQGASASFSVEVSGTSPFTFQWKKDGVAISGATSSAYSIGATSAGHAGTYSVSISNSAGTALSNGAFLTVNAAAVAPTITKQPVSQTVTEGGAVSLGVEASGTGPYSFQWFKYGNGIAGANSSVLSIPAASLSDSGNYTVSISNSAGTALSNGAFLTVNAAASAPGFVSQPASLTVNQGGAATFTAVVEGTAPFAYQWKKNGVAIAGANSASLSLSSVTVSNAGTYNVVVSNAVGSVASAGATLTVQSSPQGGSDGRLGNISSRAKVETGSGILISGFVISGSQPKTLLIRAVGPTLSNFNLSGVLQRPMIRIYSGGTLLEEIAAGGRVPSVQATRDAAVLAGAFSLPDNSSDSVIVRTFAPGGYTVHVSGTDGGTGIAIVEVYDLDSASTGGRLVNLSTRSHVGRDSSILIPGVSVSGTSPKQVLIRAVGPGLRQYNVDGVLERPRIALYQGSTLVTENTGWTTAPNAAEIPGVASRVGAFALSESSADSALLVTLAPGGYTLHISGGDGGTGVVLAEVFEVQ